MNRPADLGPIWLDDPRCRNPAVVGNKAASLALIRQRGANVPNGFCIPSVLLGESGSSLEECVGPALDRLRAPWAIRSSSTAEDAADAAFPGLFRTILDVTDRRSALEAVDSVYGSATSNTVRSYADHHGIDANSIGMSVLVQTLIAADCAGVAFSIDPVTGDTDRVSIEANYGLGETVVDGSVTPDGYSVSRHDEIVAHRLGSKKEKVVATTSGTRLRRVATSERERAASVLPTDQVVRIAKETRRLARKFDRPVDVEWALRDDELFILQVRPVTTLKGDS